MLVGSDRVLTAAGAGGLRVPLMSVDVQDNDPSLRLGSICSCQDAGRSFFLFFILFKLKFSDSKIPNVEVSRQAVRTPD